MAKYTSREFCDEDSRGGGLTVENAAGQGTSLHSKQPYGIGGIAPFLTPFLAAIYRPH